MRDMHGLSQLRMLDQQGRQRSRSKPVPFLGKDSKGPRDNESIENLDYVLERKEMGAGDRFQDSPVNNKPAGCNCKNSRCIKLYCECLKRNAYCGPHCNCRNCLNHKGETDQTIRPAKM